MPARPTVAVLGLGSIGRRHASILAGLGCDVVGWDPDETREAPGITRVARREDALEPAAAAVVASPTSSHLADAELALEAGCHVLVEKPLATTTADTERAAERASAKGLLLAVAMNLRFHPGPAEVKRVVASGRIGKPLVGRFSFGSYLPDWRPSVDYRESYSARSELGGGVLLDVIHELDYAGWVLGPAASVSALLPRVSELELDVEDVALLQLTYAGGAVASFDLDYLDRSYRRGCRVVGSEASVEWSWRDQQVRIEGPGSELESLPAPGDFAPTYEAQMRCFVGLVEAGQASLDGTPLVGADDARATLRIADAARESARAGRHVALTHGA